MTFFIATPSPVWLLVAALRGVKGIGIELKGSLPDNAVGPLAQLFCHIVPLVNDEVLIENLENFAPSEIRHDCGLRGVDVELLSRERG